MAATMSAGKLVGMRRIADGEGHFKMVATDQRPPILNLIKAKKGIDTPSYKDVADVKGLLVEATAADSTAMLLDPIWGVPVSLTKTRHNAGLIVTLEHHEFEECARNARKSRAIADWSVGKIKRMGGDAVKVLAWYRPDASAEVCEAQKAWVRAIGAACARHDILFLLEFLVYPLEGDAAQTKGYEEHKAKRPEMVVQTVREFADPRFGIDVLKLESPIPAGELPAPGAAGSAEAQAWFDKLGAAAHVPWVMLSAGASMEQFRHVLHYAYAAGASGFLAGRAVWLKAMQDHYPDLSAVRRALAGEAVPYLRAIGAQTDRDAAAWFKHRSFAGTLPGVDLGGGVGGGWRAKYAEPCDRRCGGSGAGAGCGGGGCCTSSSSGGAAGGAGDATSGCSSSCGSAKSALASHGPLTYVGAVLALAAAFAAGRALAR